MESQKSYKNRNNIKQIIEAIILCRRQNISLRGDHDDNRLTVTKCFYNYYQLMIQREKFNKYNIRKPKTIWCRA